MYLLGPLTSEMGPSNNSSGSSRRRPALRRAFRVSCKVLEAEGDDGQSGKAGRKGEHDKGKDEVGQVQDVARQINQTIMVAEVSSIVGGSFDGKAGFSLPGSPPKFQL